MYYLNTTNFYFINEPLFSCMGMYVYCSDSGSNLSTSGPQHPPPSLGLRRPWSGYCLELSTS